MYSDYTLYEIKIVDDLRLYMDRIGLRDFSGVSLPSEDLLEAFQTTNFIFYKDNTDMETTYFESICDLNLNIDEHIFYGGEANE